MKGPLQSLRPLSFCAIMSLFAAPLTLQALYSVFLEGKWPADWPEQLEGLREDARTLVGPTIEANHHGIPFRDRESFEKAWPHILRLKTEGAPILLKRGPSFWLPEQGKAGVCIHTPPTGQKPVSPESATDHWAKSIYIELIVDGVIVDLNRIPFPTDTPILDRRFPEPEDASDTETKTESTNPTPSRPAIAAPAATIKPRR